MSGDELLSIRTQYDDSGLKEFHLRRRMVEWSDRVGPQIRTDLQREAPVGDPETDPHSGRLRKAIRYRRLTTPLGVRVEWTAEVPYLPFVIHGTAQHEIHATAAQVLRFKFRGDIMFRGSVNHPATAPNDFVGRVMEHRNPWLEETFSAAMRGDI